MNVSVIMATYNGEKYLRDQLNSILCQINENDEIIISDDGSNDNTLKIIKEYMNDYKNIFLYSSHNKGASRNFLDTINLASKEIIILSDQDDIWLDGKVRKTKKFFEKNNNIKLLTHNFILIDEYGSEYSEKNILNLKHGYISNLIKSCFWGCTMAFTKDFIDFFKTDSNIIAHDQYISLIAEKHKVSSFFNETLIQHRVHSRNVSKKLKLLDKIRYRFNLIRNTIFK